MTTINHTIGDTTAELALSSFGGFMITVRDTATGRALECVAERNSSERGRAWSLMLQYFPNVTFKEMHAAFNTPGNF